MQQIELAQRAVDEGWTAEQVREAAAPIVPRRKRTSRKPGPEFCGGRNGESPDHRAPVLHTLKECCESVEQIEEWVCGRSWQPSKTSDEQRQALEGLYSRVSVLQQELIGIRRGLKAAEVLEAEQLRRAGPLPF